MKKQEATVVVSFFATLSVVLFFSLFSSMVYALQDAGEAPCPPDKLVVNQEDGSFLCMPKDTDDNIAAEVIIDMHNRIQAFERDLENAHPDLNVQLPVIDKELGTVSLPPSIKDQNTLFLQERSTLAEGSTIQFSEGRDDYPWKAHDVSWKVGSDDFNLKLGSEGKLYATGYGYQRAYAHGYFYGHEGDILENKVEIEIISEGIHGRAKISDTFRVFGLSIYSKWEYDTLILPAFEFFSQTFFYHSQYFMVGPVPLVVRTHISGHVGINPTHIIVENPLSPDLSRIAAKIRPYSRLVGSVFCGFDIGIAHAGPAGQVDLLKAEMGFPIAGQGLEKPPCIAGGLDRLSTLDGSIGIAAGIGIPVDIPNPRAVELIRRFFGFPALNYIGFYYPLFSWQGYTIEENITWFDSCAPAQDELSL